MQTVTASTTGAADETDAPIYAQLVRELGDVPAEVCQTAQAALKEAERAVNFSVV